MPRSLVVCAIALWFLAPLPAQAVNVQRPLAEVVTSSPDATFEALVERLFSHNWIILSANQQLGLITFRYQSEENSSRTRRHVNTLDGSILVRAESPTSTRVRVNLTISWQESFVDRTFATGVRNDVPAEWYKLVFDTLGLPVPMAAK